MYRLNLPPYPIKITEKGEKRQIFDFLRRKYVALTLLYNKEAVPRMIIEYKAPTIQLQQKTFDQISIYNLLLKVDYLIVSNGLQHYCCKMDYAAQRYIFLEAIPDYEIL